MTAAATDAPNIVRFTGNYPCPICGGHESLPRDKGVRCHGYLTDDLYARCSREEYSGSLERESRTGTFVHYLRGECHCGVTHRSSPASAAPAKTKRRGLTVHPTRERLRGAAEFSAEGKPVVAEYEYRDAEGLLRLIVFRIDLGDGEKTFRQGQPKGDGFVLSTAGVEHVPFHLPELRAGIDAKKTVYIAEGEKDVLAIEGAGGVATCNAMGAGKVDVIRACAPHLEGASLVRIVADQDEDGTGHNHAIAWAANLRGVAERIEILRPAEGKDAHDALVGAGLPLEYAFERVESVDDGGTGNSPADENLTDLGNARRLVRLHGPDIRYCHEFRRWYVWDGCRWIPDATGEIVRRAKSVPKDIYAAASREGDESVRKRLASHAMQSEAEPRLKAMIALAQSEPGIPVAPDELDADPWLLNTPSGIVDLRTGEVGPHRRSALCSKITAAPYDPTARSELWERCLETWLPDPESRGFFKRGVGYSLIGAVLEAVLFILYGIGANGKTVCIETVRRVIGEGYALQTPAETLIANRSTAIPNDVARLKGARFVSASESDENRRLAEAKVKQLTGGDTLTARHMRGEWFDFAPTFAVWLLTNHKPLVRGSDEGIWRRIRLVPFTVTIPEAERDGRLQERLAEEAAGILAWAVEGCLEYQRVGLAAPDAVTQATDAYRRESDTLGEFFEECCELGADRFATSKNLYEAYRAWAKAAGEDAMTKTAFGKKLAERGFDPAKEGGYRGWCGIALANLDT